MRGATPDSYPRAVIFGLGHHAESFMGVLCCNGSLYMAICNRGPVALRTPGGQSSLSLSYVYKCVLPTFF